MDSISPFGRRTANKYIGRTPDGSRRVIDILPEGLQGPAEAPKGSRAAPLDTVRFPVYLYTKVGKNNRAVPGTLAGSLCDPPGL